MEITYVGTTFVPLLFGFLSNFISFSILPVNILIVVIIMITMVERTFRMTTKNDSGNNTATDKITEQSNSQAISFYSGKLKYQVKDSKKKTVSAKKQKNISRC